MQFTGCQVKTRVVPRWNLEYDSVNSITEQDSVILDGIMKKLKLKHLNASDRVLLKEYLAVMGPIVIYLDVMQGERNTYLGCVIPCIGKIKTAIAEMTNILYRGYGANFRRGIMTHLNRR